MSGELLIALTFDLDPDGFDPSIAVTGTDGELPWRGIEEGVPMLADALSRLEGEGLVPATWFVRVDNQIAHIYSDHGALFDRFGKIFDGLIQRGDEIGWHPHLYRHEPDLGWRQENDDERLRVIMESSHAAMKRHGISPSVVRMGGNYGSNGTMATLDRLGLRFDSTAMPGRRRSDGDRDFDWQPTPAEPYRPSCADYRVPGTPAHAVTEVPMTMVPVRASYDPQPYPRYVDLSFHPEALHEGLAARLPEIDLLITVTHPSCLLSGMTDGDHGLLAFAFDAFERNLAFILSECERADRPYRFVTLSDGADVTVSSVA